MTRFKEYDLSSDHPDNHWEFGVCTTDIYGYPVLLSRIELSFSLHCCSATSQSSFLQDRERFQIGHCKAHMKYN